MRKKYWVVIGISIVLLIIAIIGCSRIFATPEYRQGIALVVDNNKGYSAQNEHIKVTNRIIDAESTSETVVLETTVTNLRDNPIDYPTNSDVKTVQVAMVVDTGANEKNTDNRYVSEFNKFLDLIKNDNIVTNMSLSTTTSVLDIGATDDEIANEITWINNLPPNPHIPNPFEVALQNGIDTFYPDAENKAMVVLTYGFIDEIDAINDLADENPDINILIVLVDATNSSAYNSLKNKSNVFMYTSSSNIDFTDEVDQIKRLFRNEIESVAINYSFSTKTIENFIIQNYETRASLLSNHVQFIGGIKGQEEVKFKYVLQLKNTINRDNMFQNINVIGANNESNGRDKLKVTYGDHLDISLDETPIVKIGEKFKLRLKAINEENEPMTENIKFHVEALDNEGNVVYSKHNQSVNEYGTLEIDNIGFFTPSGEMTLKISEAIVPQGYKMTTGQILKFNVSNLAITDQSHGGLLDNIRTIRYRFYESIKHRCYY